MPYIEQHLRPPINEHIDPVALLIKSPGELNYAISRLITIYVDQHEAPGYAAYNEVVGTLTCVKDEFYRTQLTPYEAYKRHLNGDVFDEPESSEGRNDQCDAPKGAPVAGFWPIRGTDR